MTLTFGNGKYQTVIEAISGDYFLRIPLIGELACNGVTPFCFVPWKAMR